jgi:hypothetical protein
MTENSDFDLAQVTLWLVKVIIYETPPFLSRRGFFILNRVSGMEKDQPVVI